MLEKVRFLCFQIKLLTYLINQVLYHEILVTHIFIHKRKKLIATFPIRPLWFDADSLPLTNLMFLETALAHHHRYKTNQLRHPLHNA